MRDGFRNSEEAVHVIRSRKHLARDVPRCSADLRHQGYDLSLSLLDGAQVAIKKFFVVVDWFAMATVYQRRGKGAQTRETDQVFCKGAKAAGLVDRIRRENWIRRDSFEHTVARNYGAVGFA